MRASTGSNLWRLRDATAAETGALAPAKMSRNRRRPERHAAETVGIAATSAYGKGIEGSAEEGRIGPELSAGGCEAAKGAISEDEEESTDRVRGWTSEEASGRAAQQETAAQIINAG